MTRCFSDELVLSRNAVWRWKTTNQPLTDEQVVAWFDVAYPEKWTVKMRRLMAATDEAATFTDYKHRKAAA